MAKTNKPKTPETLAPKLRLKKAVGGKDDNLSGKELGRFTSLRAEVEAKMEATDAKFSAAEMGVGTEATLGAKFLRLFADIKKRAERTEAYNAYDPFNKVYLTGGIKTQDQLQED